MALIPLFAIVIACYRRQGQQGGWASVCDAHLLPHLLVGSDRSSLTMPLVLLSCGWVLATVALAGPAWSKLPQSVFRNQSALIIVLDLSQSMDSQDIQPSRLERAKFKTLDILDNRQEGLTGLIVFAKESFVVSPLTDDNKTISAMIPSLETQLMPEQGSHVEQALQEANHLFDQSRVQNGQILVITDGPPSTPDYTVLAKLHNTGRTVSILGIGTEEGAPIPTQGGGFLKDAAGSIVIPKRNVHTLQAMAEAGGGTYMSMTMDNDDVQTLLSQTSPRNLSPTIEVKERTTERWREEGPWVVLAILLFAAPAFRVGWLETVLILLMIPSGAYALNWEDLWFRPDQRGAQLLEEKDPAQAAQTFQDPAWKGIAHYQAGEYAQAAEAFKGIDSADAQFNLGNVLAQSGRLQEALTAYQTALTKDPHHDDAQFNYDLIKEFLSQQDSSQNQEERKQSPGSDSDSNSSQSEPQEQSPDSNSTSNPLQEESQTSQAMPATTDNHSAPLQSQEPSHTQDTPSTQQHKATQPQPDVMNDDLSLEDFANKKEPNQRAHTDASPKTFNKEKDQALASSATDHADSDHPPDAPSLDQSENQHPDQERQQALAQWLRRVPDDPGGLLRRKFYLEHLKRKQRHEIVKSPGEQAW